MSDYISRADAIEAVCDKCPISFKEKCEWKDNGHCSMKVALEALPSAEPSECESCKWYEPDHLICYPNDDSDLISRQWLLDLYGDYIGDNGEPKYHVPLEAVRQNIKDAPSADAESDDLIIKGAKGIQDGLYNIKDGKLFKYKANGGTVRTYPIVPSADAVQGEWIHDGQNFKGGLDWCHCSECGYKTSTNGLSVYRYCPSCGARMKGGAEE